MLIDCNYHNIRRENHMKTKISTLSAITAAAVFCFQQPVWSASDPVVCSGCVGSGDIANNAVTNGKVADSAITSSKIANGATVKSLNNLKDNVVLQSGTGISITTNGSAITIASTTPASTGSTNASNGVVSIDAGNYSSASIKSGDYVNIKGQINLTGNLELFRDKENLHINGGIFQGTGKETIYLSKGATIENTTFDNVKISVIQDSTAYPIKFLNCKLSRLTAFDAGNAVITGSLITNTPTRLGFYGTIENSTISQDSVKTDGSGEIITSNIVSSKISNVTLFPSRAINNELSGVSVIGRGKLYFDGNSCDQCDLTIETGNGPDSVTNNTFLRPRISQYDHIIKIQETPYLNTTSSVLRIENNVFTNEALNDVYYVDIALDGTFNSPLTMLSISNNTFINPSRYKAAQAINDISSGDIKRVIKNNTTSNINLGVPEDGQGITNNLSF